MTALPADNPGRKAASESPRAPGRPRDPVADQAILETTVRLLVEQGYDAMSIEGVAAGAGVGKPTIYRRYASKRELVIGALSSLVSEIDRPGDSGSTRDDLMAFVRQSFGILRQGGFGFAIIGTLLVRERDDPELLELFRSQVVRPRLEAAAGILRQGIERGEVRSDVPPEIAVQMIVGAIWAGHVAGQPEDDDWLDSVLETLWRGLAAR